MAVKKSTASGKSPAKPAGSSTKKRRSTRRKKKKSTLSAPLFAAFFAGILMAVVCFFGVRAALYSDSRPTVASQETASSPSPKTRPDARSEGAKKEAGQKQGKPAILPSVDRAARNAQAPVLGDVEAALAELQEAASTDQITPFVETLQLVDFAFEQTRRSLRVPEANVLALSARAGVTRAPDGKPLDFSIQRHALLTNSSLFAKNFSQALEEWAPRAALSPSPVQVNGASLWDVRVEGELTHSLVFYEGRGQFPGKNALVPPPSGQWPDREGGKALSGQAAPDRKWSGKPVLVVVIDDLGASREALDRLLRLNFPVTCAFWPFAAHTDSGAERAHRAGMEILVHMPMEPVGSASQKSDPDALLMRMGASEIAHLVRGAIAKVPHATGLNNHKGSRFTQSAEKTAAVVEVLKQSGLFCLDSVTHSQSVFYGQAGRAGVLRYRRDVFLDVQNSRAAVLAALARAERIALSQGYAVAIGHPLSGTLSALEEWQQTRNPAIGIVRLRDLQGGI